jgi:hypothetical protein
MAATSAATMAATRAATDAATSAATRAATSAATRDANKKNTINFLVKFLIGCSKNYWNMWNGGNQWSGYVSYLSFFRYIAKLDLPIYDKFDFYEKAAMHGGPRMMTADFCMVSDMPLFIKRDAQNRPHADGEPFCQWRDGWALHYFHGVKLPPYMHNVKSKDWEAKWILTEQNAEIRRLLIETIGYGKICRDLNAKNMDSWREYELLRIDNADVEPIVMVKMTCPSTRMIHAHRVHPSITSARAAITAVNGGIDPEEFGSES